MAKYCIKCGRQLPKGTEVCPDCAAEMRERDAALFTKMTAETEIWKDTEPVKQKRPRVVISINNRRTLFMGAAALLVLIAAVTLFLLFRPAARVARAIRGGEFQRAYELYWSSASLAGERVPTIDKAILTAADGLCTQFADNQIDADTAASQLSLLGGFGEGAAEMLEDTYARFRSYNSSHEHMDTAQALFDAEDFLAAREEFLLVEEGDADFETAQARAAECLDRYGEAVAARAGAQMEENDFPAALETLRQGNSTLFELDTFSGAIDDGIVACIERYERYTLNQAAELAELEDYDAAVSAIVDCIDVLGSHTEGLLAAREEYAQMAADKRVADAGARADELYDAGEYAEAFAVLEELRAQESDNDVATGADALIVVLETRFSAAMCAQAEKTFSGDREKLPDAVQQLDNALEIRDLESIRTYREDLAQYLPLSLVTAEYAAKEGTVFRSDGTFESLDGSSFKKGWIWGANGAELCFALDGKYDVLQCTFATRRKDSANASGSFELWCDGEKVYTADKLYHFQKESRSINVDVSGCQELKLIFRCDYTVSTAENGYCYHGICDPVLTKNLPVERAG